MCFTSERKTPSLLLFLKQELTPLDIKPVDDVLCCFQEGRLQAKSGLSSATLHLTALGFVSGGAKFAMIEDLLLK